MEYVCLHLGCDPLWEMGSWFREVVYLERLLTNLRLLMVERFQQKTMPDKIAVDHASRCDTQATPLCDCSRGHASRKGDGEMSRLLTRGLRYRRPCRGTQFLRISM